MIGWEPLRDQNIPYKTHAQPTMETLEPPYEPTLVFVVKGNR